MGVPQANPNEIITQLGSVLLAGAKGMTLFQTVHKIFQQVDLPSSPLVGVFQSIAAVRETLRVGDIAGLKFATSAVLNKQVMIEVVRSPTKVVVVVVSTNAAGYNNHHFFSSIFFF